MTVTVYSKPACSQCDATYRALDKKGIEYTPVNYTEDPVALEKVMNSGFMSAPVVEVVLEDGTTKMWGGFRIDEINALAAA